MSYRPIDGGGALLRIYISEFDKYQHHTLYELILQRAHEAGLAGCTVFRGYWGFGVRGFIHTDIWVETAGERPVLVEIVDSRDRVVEFSRTVVPLLEKAGGLITEEPVHIHRYQHANSTGATAQMPSEGKTMAESLDGEQSLLRIFIGESDQVGHKPLFEIIVERCKGLGMAGCTTIQGVLGYGASSVIHRPHVFRVSQDVPIVIEVVDSPEKVRALLTDLNPMLQGALVTEEKVQVHHQAARKE